MMNVSALQPSAMQVAGQRPQAPSLQPPTAESWMDSALCTQADPDMFFPEGKGASTVDAKRLCALCPVQAECLTFALDHHEVWGVWGGLSEKQRRGLRRGAA